MQALALVALGDLGQPVRRRKSVYSSITAFRIDLHGLVFSAMPENDVENARSI